jgi:hypothetical protein
MSKTVQIYNFETEQVMTIPASELAPGMVEAEVQGIGRVWIDPSKTKEIPGFRHRPLSEEARHLIRTIKSSLDEVYPKSLTEWEDGFRKDSNPEYEIALWLHIASVFERFTQNRSLSFSERHEYFKVLVTCSLSSKEHVFEVLQLHHLPKQEAEKVVAAYYG